MNKVLPCHPGIFKGFTLAACLIFWGFQTSAGTINKANNATNLNLGGSWVGGVAPGAADIALWNSTVTSANSVGLGADASWSGLSVGNAGGPVSITGANTLTLGADGINLSASLVDVSLGCALSNSFSAAWNAATNRILTLAGGVSVAGSSVVISKTGPGSVILSGSNAFGSLGVSAGSCLMSTGTLATSGTGTGGFAMTGSGTFLQSGGAVSVSGYSTVGYPTISSNPAKLVLTNGTFYSSGEFLIGYGGNGILTIAGTASVTGASNLRFGQSGNATVNLFGGTLKINTWSTGGGSSASVLLLSGGTLIYGGSGGTVWGPVTGLAAYISTNTSTLNDNGKNLTLSQPLLHHPALGATTDGGLIKTGAGNLTLTATNTFTGPLVVSNGTVTLNGAISGVGGVKVYSGATLAGTGTIAGPVSVADGATLAPGAGTLTVGNLVLGTNANLVFTLGLAGSATNSAIKVNGNLVLDGNLNVFDNGNMSTGAVYAVINYTGALTNRGLTLNPNSQWNVTVDTSVTNYVRFTATREYLFLEITNGDFAVTSTYTNLGGLIHGSTTFPLWYEVRDQTNRLWDYGSTLPSASWSITVRHLRAGTNTVWMFAKDASRNLQSNRVQLVMTLNRNSPVRPRPTPAEIWWGGTCHDNIRNDAGSIIGTHSRMDQLANTNLSWDFVKRFQDGFFLHGYVWVNGAARMTNWVSVGQIISSQLLPFNGKYWLEDGWGAQAGNMNYGHSSASGQNNDIQNMLNIGFAVGEISQDSGIPYSSFSNWHPDWLTNDIRVLITGNTNQASPAYPYSSGQWLDYATDFHGYRPNVQFGWTWSPVWFHWLNGASLGSDHGIFSITTNSVTYNFNWDFYDFMNDAVSVGKLVGVPFSFASDCPWDYYGKYPGNPGGWSPAQQLANRIKIRNYEAWLQKQNLRHILICNYSAVNTADTNASDLAYESGSLNTMYVHQQEGGRANSYRFESWYADPYTVVPETKAGSYTHLVLTAIKYLKGIADTNGTLEALNLTPLATNGTIRLIQLKNNGDVQCLPALAGQASTVPGVNTRYFTTNGVELTTNVLTAEGFCYTNLLQPGAAINFIAVTLAAGMVSSTNDDASLEAFWNPQDPLGIVRDREFFTTPLTPLGSWHAADIGSVGIPGGSAIAGTNLTLLGSGADVWGTADACHFLWQTNVGDGSMTARITSQLASDVWAKAGVMVRESLAANAKNVYVCLTPNNGVSFQNRPSPGGATYNVAASGPAAPYWVRLTRSGTTFTAQYSANGSTWTTLVSSNLTGFASTALWGLAVTAHNNALGSAANFDNVSLPNAAPVLGAISNRTLIAGQTLNVTNSAADANVPPQTLTYSLAAAPTNAVINATSGLLTWRPLISQSPTANAFSVVVTDNSQPPLSATQNFTVTVLRPAMPGLVGTSAAVSNGFLNLWVTGDSGPNYTLLMTTNLASPIAWQAIQTNVSAVAPFYFQDPVTNAAAKYYRIQLGP